MGSRKLCIIQTDTMNVRIQRHLKLLARGEVETKEFQPEIEQLREDFRSLAKDTVEIPEEN